MRPRQRCPDVCSRGHHTFVFMLYLNANKIGFKSRRKGRAKDDFSYIYLIIERFHRHKWLSFIATNGLQVSD